MCYSQHQLINKHQQQINLNFQVVPTAQGPMIVQKGVTVQPGTLDSLFAQLKYQNIHRPVSARIRNDSFGSSQSWDGPAHFKTSAIRLQQNRGDRPGLGKHYNPTRHRKRHSANRRSGNNSRGQNLSQRSQDECDVGSAAAEGRHVEINTSNVDSKGLHTQRDKHPFMRIDAQSQTEVKTMEAYCAYDIDDSSVSPDGRKPTTQVGQYTIQPRPRVGVGMGLIQNMASSTKAVDQPRESNLTSVDRRSKLFDSMDKRGGAYCEIGQIPDPLVSTIDHKNEESRASPDLKIIRETDFYKDFTRGGPYEQKQNLRGLNTGVHLKENLGQGSFSDSKSISNSQSQDLVMFKRVLSEQRNPSWTEDNFQKGQFDLVSFAQKTAHQCNFSPQKPLIKGAGEGSVLESSPPLGTTPGFDSAGSNAAISVFDDERRIKSHRIPQENNFPRIENTGTLEHASQRREKLLGQSQSHQFKETPVANGEKPLAEDMQKYLSQKQGNKVVNEKAQLLRAGLIHLSGEQPTRAKQAENFYNLDKHVGLFATDAGQTVSTNNGGHTENLLILEEGQENLVDHLVTDELAAERQNTHNSNIIWQASSENKTPRNCLNIVNEEENSHATSDPVNLLSSRKNSNVENASSQKNSSAQKTLVKKKKKTVSKTLKSSISIPGLPKSNASSMKIETVNTTSQNKLVTMKMNLSKLNTGLSKMVLKSNIAMDAELPKNQPKTLVKKASPKTSSKAQTKDAKKAQESDRLCTDELQTPNDIITPPDLGLDFTTPEHLPERGRGSVPVNEITLVASAPIKPKKLISMKNQIKGIEEYSTDNIKINISKSVAAASKIDQLEDLELKSVQRTKENCFSGELSPCAPMSLAQKTFDLNTLEDVFSTSKIDLNMQMVKSQSQHSQSSHPLQVTSTSARKKKMDKDKSSRNESNQLSSKKSQSPTKSSRELQVLEIPREYDTESDHVVEYMLGDKAIEIEAPLYQVNISNKLVYQLTQINGDEPPSFIKLVENKLGRKVIRIRQKETTGVQQLVQLKLEVRNPDTNVSGIYKCRVFIKPGVKLLLKKPLFSSPVDYSIKGPATILQMPIYSAKHDDLDFYLEPMGQGAELPSFIRISRDADGNRCIKCQGNHIYEIGTYNIKLIARDKITRVINEDFIFTVVGTPGIEVKHLPKEYEEEIKLDPNQSCYQFAMPVFNLETVKEEEAMPLEYSLVMRDGSKVPDFIFIKMLADGEHIIELKAADLPPGLNKVFEVQLRVYDPNADATQLIPISVKCPEPNLMLTMMDTNFPEEISYSIGSKAILVRVPQYERNDGKPLLEPVLLTLGVGGRESSIVNRLAQIHSNERGEQFIKIEIADSRLKGTYEVKVYATEQNSGLTCQDASFMLIVAESVLTLTDTPNVCFLGKPLVYQPKGPPTYVPLPQYATNRAQIQFSIVSEDPSCQVPSFVRIQGDYLIVEGTQNPTTRIYNLKLKAFDPVSESKEEMPIKITSDIYEIRLEKVPFTSPIEFFLGDDIKLPMPIYKELPFSSELVYELEIQGVGMMLAGIELASIVYAETGAPQIRIAGGENSNKGTYQVTVVAKERTLGVTNRQATFMLEAKPQLKLVSRPSEFDKMPQLRVDQVYKIPVPTFASKNRLRYQIQERGNTGTDDEQSCPSFITVKCPKQAQPYIEIKCNGLDIPSKRHYKLELISCDNKQHNIENIQEFSLDFDLQPKLDLVSFDVDCPVKYRLKQGQLKFPMPIYSSYMAEVRNLDIKLISDFNERPIPFGTVDRERNEIVIEAENEGFEGLHDITVVVAIPEYEKPRSSSPIKPIKNTQAKFRVEICATEVEIHSPKRHDTHRMLANLHNQRSAETLPLADAQSEGIMSLKRGGYRKSGAVVHAVGGEFGDKISKIEENEDIPIYYSDQSDEHLPITPTNEEESHQNGVIHVLPVYNHQRDTNSEITPRQSGVIRLQQSKHEDDVVATRIDGKSVDQQHQIRQDQDRRMDSPFDNHVFIDDNAVPKEQIEMQTQIHRQMLVQENEEIRRQIAELRNQMDAQVARGAFSSVGGHLEQAPQTQLNSPRGTQNKIFQDQSQIRSPEGLSAIYASMQLLKSYQPITFSSATIQNLLVSNLQEAQLQDEQILNNQLRQKIEQSKARQMQQMSELERIRNEVNLGATSQQQQLLNRYLNETNRDGQGREKDTRLRQLRTQLAQLQETRSNLRKQCTSLKQKEDDLQSDIFMRDQQLKHISKMNSEESTKVSSLLSETDRVIYRNESLRTEVQALEEQLEEKKQLVNQNKARLRDVTNIQTDLEEKISSHKHRVNKLRVEVESVKRRLDHEESMMHAAPTHFESQANQERLQTATFSPPSIHDSKYIQYQRGQGNAMRNSVGSALQLHKLEYEMPTYIHGDAVQQQPNSARNQNQNHYNSVAYKGNHLNQSANNYRFNHTSHNPLSGFFQPQDDEMPAAGMPSSSQKSGLSSALQPQYNATQMTAFISPANRGIHGNIPVFKYKNEFHSNSSERKIINPIPQRACKPRENNIFGEVSSPVQVSTDATRFQTTYTQFANREKFRGLREGEFGGLRIDNVPQNGVCRLEQMKRQSSNLYPGVPHGLASGVTTEMRRIKEKKMGGVLLPASNQNVTNYEKKYRH